MTVSSITAEDYPTDVSTMYDYELTGWDKTVDEVNSALTNGKNVTVTAKLKALSTSYTVTVYNGDSTEPTITTYTESKTISVTAVAVSGKTFAYRCSILRRRARPLTRRFRIGCRRGTGFM